MKHIDLFSGIGGFALAIDRVWPGTEHIFCDNEPFSQEILKKHWPGSQIYGDIRTLTANAERSRHIHRESEKQSAKSNIKTQRKPVADIPTPFILTGGFPCQPFSQAGRRKGTEDDRHLWPEMLRVIQEFSPEWVVGENVGGLITWNNGLVFEQVCSDLEGEGYEVQSFVIPAVAVNAPHRRDRVWIIANRRQQSEGKQKSGSSGRGKPSHSPGKQSEKGNGFTNKDSDASNGPGKRLEGGDLSKEPSKKEWRRDSRQIDWNQNWLEIATRFCRMDDGLPRRMDRNPRLKALGNAIVPQVAEEIMRAIKLSTQKHFLDIQKLV